MAYRCAAVGVIVAFVAPVQLGPSARASEPGLGAPLMPGWSVTIPGEFQTLVGDRVFFSEGSAELGARARKALAAQAAWLARHPSLGVTIEGHADDPGADDHQLSQRRAEAVRQRLIETGIAPERIRTVAYGRQRLVAECAGSACGAQNRRAITVVGAPTAAANSGEARNPRNTLVRPSPRRLY
jgi:outer membrane protein OmpA-like peptidoglycan-associated protein